MLARGFGGAERAFADTALALASRGHDVLAICHAGFSKKELLADVPNLDLKTVRASGELDFLTPLRIAAMLKAFDADVVHTQLRRAAWHGGKAAHYAEVPLVSKLHNYVNLGRYKYVHTLIGTTEDQRCYALDKGWPSNRVVVIPNFSRVPPVEEAPGVRKEPLRLLSYGRYVRKKGFDLLLHAFRALLDSGMDARLTIGGQGPELEALTQLSCELNLQGRVELGVWVDDVQRALDEADVFVLPSMSEPFGIVMLESMARGLPIVTTRTQGPSQVLSNETAFFAKIGSVDSLVDALIQAVQNPQAAQKKAQAALELYRTTYYEDAVVPQLEALYRAVSSR